MTREKRYLVASIALAIVALIVLGAGIAAQGSIDWSQSSVTPNHTPVRAGERVTFTIQVVNSSTVTATDVFVYNPIPKGTDFVTVGNGFPIVGGEAETVNAQAMDTPDVSVSSGEAYDASTDSTVPLDSVDPGDVTAVGWVGDVGPGAANATSMDLALDAVSVSPVDPVITDTAYVYHAGTMTSVSGTVETVGATTVIYMPIMVHNADMSPPLPTEVITVPLENNVMGFSMYGDTFEEVDDCEYPDPKGRFLNVNINTDDYGVYHIRRSFFEVEIPEGVEIISASVSAAMVASWNQYNEPLPTPTVSIHPGTWDGDMWSVPQCQIWGAFEREQVVGRYDTSPVYALLDNHDLNPEERVSFPLDVSYLVPGQAARFVFRDSEDHLDLSGEDGNQRTVFLRERKSWIELTVEEVNDE
jgi:uncharacterized repeat protein (TIGR01451 family)